MLKYVTKINRNISFVLFFVFNKFQPLVIISRKVLWKKKNLSYYDVRESTKKWTGDVAYPFDIRKIFFLVA